MFNETFVVLSFFFALGASLGSFANVVIVRLPKNKSVIRPASHCPHCLKPISWYENLPLVSWIFLRGKCRHCHHSISSRYFIVELITGLLFVGATYFDGISWLLLEHLIFIFSLVVCSFIDLEHMILPDEFTLSGIIIGLIGAWLNPQRQFLDAFFGVLMGGGFLWLMAYLYFVFTKKEGMGGGDIKLLAWIGAVLGWQSIPFVIFLSAVLGTIFGISLYWKERKGLKTVIPYGPYLALAAVAYIFGLQTLAQQYLAFFLPEFVANLTSFFIA